MLNRRRFLVTTALSAAVLPFWARSAFATPASFSMGEQALRPDADGALNLTIGETEVLVDGKPFRAKTINGTMPGPLLYLREGSWVTINVTNTLDEDTSLHWHGILLPADMDGVPGLSFPGIKPGETFTYRYKVSQSGTYWYHSHSGLQEQEGVFGPLVIEPANGPDEAVDADHVIMLGDWAFEPAHEIYRRLKMHPAADNRQHRTMEEFFADVEKNGLAATLADRRAWGDMRMDPTDISDVTSETYTYHVNGHGPADNWTALFKPGQALRLRFINVAAMSIFNLRIPGVEMEVVATDGQPVQGVKVDELQISVAETYDVIVRPGNAEAYTIFAETIDGAGYARATLAQRAGAVAAIPARRARPTLTMKDMGHGDMAGTDHGATDHSKMNHGGHGAHSSHQQKALPQSGEAVQEGPGVDMLAMAPANRTAEPGLGQRGVDHRVLRYADLKARHHRHDVMRPPTRELTLNLTGNMERYMWSFDGVKYAEVKGPIPFRQGERLRLTLINHTMMNHPIHLHGMWMELENGQGHMIPRKHTINVKPGEKVSALITVDAPVGLWAFHCHMLYHMKAGMMRAVEVRA